MRNFFKSNTEIITVKKFKSNNWQGNGIIFYVQKGKGLLSMKYGYIENDSVAILTYGNVPLLKFHSDSPYYCPTCEKLVAAGYGLEMIDQQAITQLRELMNHKFVSLEESLDNLKPLLGLLPTGYYALIDTELCPTDGNGNFFWKLNNKPIQNKASCQFYEEELFCEGFPYFLLPTQPPTYFNPEQAQYYRNKEDYRAIAFYMEGFLCALLDGHHKAVAAAIEKKKVKTLVIVPITYFHLPDDKQKGGISICGTFLSDDELPVPSSKIIRKLKSSQLTKKETKKYLSMYNHDFDQKFNWPHEILIAEKYYPDVTAVVRQQSAGDISDERLDSILKNVEIITDQEALNIVTALYYTKNPRFKEMAFYFGRNDSFVHVWYQVYKLLSNIKDEEVENFFVEFLIEDKKEYKDIKRIIDNYFSN